MNIGNKEQHLSKKKLFLELLVQVPKFTFLPTHRTLLKEDISKSHSITHPVKRLGILVDPQCPLLGADMTSSRPETYRLKCELSVLPGVQYITVEQEKDNHNENSHSEKGRMEISSLWSVLANNFASQ